jgi:hypothetical protein
MGRCDTNSGSHFKVIEVFARVIWRCWFLYITGLNG